MFLSGQWRALGVWYWCKVISVSPQGHFDLTTATLLLHVCKHLSQESDQLFYVSSASFDAIHQLIIAVKTVWLVLHQFNMLPFWVHVRTCAVLWREETQNSFQCRCRSVQLQTDVTQLGVSINWWCQLVTYKQQTSRPGIYRLGHWVRRTRDELRRRNTINMSTRRYFFVKFRSVGCSIGVSLQALPVS